MIPKDISHKDAFHSPPIKERKFYLKYPTSPPLPIAAVGLKTLSLPEFNDSSHSVRFKESPLQNQVSQTDMEWIPSSEDLKVNLTPRKTKQNSSPHPFRKPAHLMGNAYSPRWIENLPLKEKNRRKFDKKASAHIKSYLATKNLMRLCLEEIEDRLKEFVRREFYKILFVDRENFEKNPLSLNFMSSPRSTQYMSETLKKIQKNELLTEDIIRWFSEMRAGLVDYLKEKKCSTEWTKKLMGVLDNLISHGKDLVKFVEAADSINDPKTEELFQPYVDKNLFDFLRKYTSANSYNELRHDFAEIHLDFLDALKIPGKLHPISEPENAVISFADVEMRRILLGFSNLHLERLTINRENIDDARSFTRGNLDVNRQFFTDFLSVYYGELRKELSPNELEKEVENLLLRRDVPSKELFSLCVIPWLHFFDVIRALYPGLQSGIETLPDESSSHIHIEVKPDGINRIVRAITYRCYPLVKPHEEAPLTLDLTNPIGAIKFLWTVAPIIDEEGKKTWSGCIQIPPHGLEINEHATSEMKRKILRALIDYVDDNDQRAVGGLPFIEEKQTVAEFEEELYKRFDSPDPYIGSPQPSPFMLEFMIKNYCRTEIVEKAKYTSSFLNECDDEGLAFLSEKISEELKRNGHILEPFISRLSVFEQLLCRYLMIKSRRTEWTDQLIAYLKELLQSAKYTESGPPDTNILARYLKILDEDIHDLRIQTLILKVMCGRWKNFEGQKDERFQKRNIADIMTILRYVRDSSKWLKPILREMIEEERYQISLAAISAKTYFWIEQESKQSSISTIDMNQIVRCFMHSTKPLFKEVIVNGFPVDGGDLVGDEKERKITYYKRLLTAIYRFYAPEASEESIAWQAETLVDYDSYDAETKARASATIPCLNLLKLCANSCWMVADIYIRNLFDINDPPIKSNSIQGMSCTLLIDDENNYSVEHRRTYGIYPRENPDDINSSQICKNECLAEISFSWKLYPYSDEGRMTTKGELKITDIAITPGILPEYERLLLRALENSNSDFLKIKGWEDLPKIPTLHMPLGISALSNADGKKRMLSPRFKIPLSPRSNY